jgi:probable HAF family extracellular repeat protein
VVRLNRPLDSQLSTRCENEIHKIDVYYRDDVIRCRGDPASAGCTERASNQPKNARYTITDVGTLGGTFSTANGLNSKGAVAGAFLPAGDMVLHAFLWQNGVMTDLGTLGPK